MSTPTGHPDRFAHAVLSNGRYRVLLSDRGTGRSSRGARAVNRWAGDAVSDFDGIFFYIHERGEAEVWSPTAAPLPGAEPGWVREAGAVRFEREHRDIESKLQVHVDPGRDFELRELTLTNRGPSPRRLELSLYVEVTLATVPAFEGHPVFSKLFLQTEFHRESGSLRVRRRPRGSDETHPLVVGALLGDGELSYDTDRAAVLGRGRSPRRPALLDGPLAGTVGNVLDPCLCLRREIELGPGESRSWTAVVGMVEGAAEADAALHDYASGETRARTLQGAKLLADSVAQSLQLSPRDAFRLQALAAALDMHDPRLRRRHGLPAEFRPGSSQQRKLAKPQVVVDTTSDPGTVREIERAAEYWKNLGCEFELKVLRPSDPIAPVERARLERGASLLVRGPLCEWDPVLEAPRHATRPSRALEFQPATPNGAPENLQFFNGLGGFSGDGTEYVLRLRASEDGRPTLPPRPWSNIIANPHFGVQVSERGALSTWKANSRLFRLTPWPNDPLGDPHTEAFFLRDDESGEFWSPLPGPAPSGGDYEVRHGMGATRFRHRHAELWQETTVFVPFDRPVRICRVYVENRGNRKRKLSAFGYAELVMGATAAECRGDVVLESHGPNTLIARSEIAGPFEREIAFSSVKLENDGARASATGDRRSFLGVNGFVGNPAAVDSNEDLDGADGRDLEPCFAHRVRFELEPGAHATVLFLLGSVTGESQVIDLLDQYRSAAQVEKECERSHDRWLELVGGVRLQSPSPGLDLMVNGWLLYQTASCRMWGRTATYQSGGAFGFRDQLQDAGAFLQTDPSIPREQILLHAAHQFVEGDVLHWWHPPYDEGIRTRFADDLLWLPLLTLHYLQATGDVEVLDEVCPYLRARELEPGEDETYLRPEPSGESGTVFEHCCRALDRSLELGANGLPLFGTGDWNDGMNRVGREGRGESVWMGFFLITILRDFAPLCLQRGDTKRGRLYEGHMKHLLEAVNDTGWDGEWYRRGYYDDGSPLGSKESDECQIDALAQAWSVLSGAASPARASQALASLEEHLISREEGLIRLLTPAFHDTPHDPGYIKGYVPGVRENGGQYTHAALWVVRAFAEAGRNDRVAELLDLLNPVHHARNAEEIATYQVEPYVVAADVYGVAPHVGRGGWTWYTGSSGWMYRVAVESLLGLSVHAGRELRLKPCLPASWPQLHVSYRPPGHRGTVVEIELRNAGGEGLQATVNGRAVAPVDGEFRWTLPQDGATHQVELTLGATRAAAP